ncbi:dsDNA helicase [Corynebacterium phage EmiRose]|uniref:DsDNA helicase n=1 Tax=Corynebacterium phage EmiRose TaxID=2565372 RepID=A0A649VQ43_9CAUD|nr:dsDNA helicase [Corynebacterium phage EmiRose]QGJ94165.1 dsDNA helicase [Corynebacterium phage EmiRose]
MFGSTRLTSILGVSLKDDSAESLIAYTRSLAKLGLSVMLINPGSKVPLDMRTAKEKEKDLAAGITGSGLHIATTDTRRLKSYITRAMADPDKKRAKTTPAPVGRPNLAVRLRGSGYVVADADTPGEVESLQKFLGYPGGRPVSPTVTTPGSADGSHHGGGHWWFKLPPAMELDYDVLPSVMKLGEGDQFSLYVGDAYVLIPPSARPEGTYDLVAPDTPAGLPMVAALSSAQKQGTARLEQRAEREEKREEVKEQREQAAAQGMELPDDDFDTQVADWNRSMPWCEILSPAGWVDTGTVDQCTCEIWTAPGAHSSPKSATAHGPGCTLPTTDTSNPPLHVWTDNAGEPLESFIRERGTKTISKLNVFALLAYDGDLSKACTAAGFSREMTGQILERSERVANEAAPVDKELPEVVLTPETVVSVRREEDWEYPREWTSPELVGVVTATGADVFESWGTSPARYMASRLPSLGSLSSFKDMPLPEFLIEGFIQQGGLAAVIGKPGQGKTGVVVDMAASIAAGVSWHRHATKQAKVLYVAAEGATGVAARFRAWQEKTGLDIENDIFIVPENIPANEHLEWWVALTREVIIRGVGLVVFDTFARLVEDIEENSAKEVGQVVSKLDRLKALTGATVLIVHHTAKANDEARGSGALLGALDSQILITHEMADGGEFPKDNDAPDYPGEPLTALVTKQKNAAEGESVELCKVDCNGVLVMTDLAGHVGPARFADVGADLMRTPEPVSKTWERIREYMRGTAIKVKISNIMRNIGPDSARANWTSKQWRNHLEDAISYGIKNAQVEENGAVYELI